MKKFIPFGEKYKFNDGVLIKTFPEYFSESIERWLWDVLLRESILYVGSDMDGIPPCIVDSFKNKLQISFREIFPSEWRDFYAVVYGDTDRLTNFLAYCLQSFAYGPDADRLDLILSAGGSAYSTYKVDKKAGDFLKGNYNLTYRVPAMIQTIADKALKQNELLNNAWMHCYSRNPDYEKVVKSCQNFLEGFLRDLYEPKNTRPQLGKLIGNLKASKKLNYKGSAVLCDKNVILLLIDNMAQYRGMHTAGTGKNPGREEGEFFLHATIFIWNLHQ